MIFAFIDESGHPHPNDSSSRPVLAAACFEASELKNLNTQIFRLKSSLLGKEQFEIEMKAKDLVTRATFRRRPDKREFVEAFFEMVRNAHLTLFAVVMERPLTPPPTDKDVLPMPFRNILQRVNRFVETESPTELGAIMFDGNGSQYNQLAERFSNWLFKSRQGQSLTHLAESPFFVDSRYTPGIQVADMIAGVVRIYQENNLNRSIPRGDSFLSAIARYYKIVEQKTVDLTPPTGTQPWYGIYFMSERMHHVFDGAGQVEEQAPTTPPTTPAT
ncbi:MAG: DUF3800 domain-containing protein [Dehalococcoidia bacterium]|nr:DUF3800 domain-containing protein [Dehalococcoidia bacterium]